MTLKPELFKNDDADALLGQLTVITRKETEKVKDEINNVEINITKTLNDAMDDTKTQITTQVDPLVIEINSLVDEANEAGIDPGPCIGDLDLVTKAPYSLLNDVVGCITGLLNEFLLVINTALKSVTELLSIVTDLTSQLKKCSGLLAIACIAKVALSITAQIVQVPLKAAKIVTDVVGLLGRAKLGLDKCAVGRVASVVAVAVKTAGTIVTCLTKLLGK